MKKYLIALFFLAVNIHAMENDRLDYGPLYDLIHAGLSPSQKNLKIFSGFVKRIKIRPSFYRQLLSDYDARRESVEEWRSDCPQADKFSSLLILETFIKELTAELMRKGINFSEAQLLPAVASTDAIGFDDEEG